MCKGLYTILITINIVTTIAISSFCFVLFFVFLFVCFFRAIGLSVLLLSDVIFIK